MFPFLTRWGRYALAPFTDADGFAGSKIWFFAALTNVMVVWNIAFFRAPSSAPIPEIPYNVLGVLMILGGVKAWQAKLQRDVSPYYARTLSAVADLKASTAPSTTTVTTEVKSAGAVKTPRDPGEDDRA